MPEILKKYSMSYYYFRWNAVFLLLFFMMAFKLTQTPIKIQQRAMR